MPEDILTLIKSRVTVRRYLPRPVPQKIISKIIEAGRWGPALLALGLQPWKFIVITNKKTASEISSILLKRSKTVGVGGNIILKTASATIGNAPLVIAVYNTGCVSKLLHRFKKIYIQLAKFAETCAIAASIQNMTLVASSLGLGACWHDAPLFCEKSINKLLNCDDRLLAIVTFGYPAYKAKRSPRKALSETTRFIK